MSLFDTIGKKAAWFTGIAGAMIIVFQVTDYLGVRVYTIGEARELEQQVQSNTQTLLLQRWQYLEAKRINQGLGPQEKFEYCQISKQLGFQGPGCA